MTPEYTGALSDPEIIKTDPSSLTLSQHSRLYKALGKCYNFKDGGNMMMAEYLILHPYDHKIHETCYFSSRKVDGCYARLKRPRHHYMVILGDIGLDIPKLLYDIITNLPERILDHKPQSHII